MYFTIGRVAKNSTIIDASVKKLSAFHKPADSLPCSQQPTNHRIHIQQFINYLTPFSRVCEKLIVTKLDTKFPAFYLPHYIQEDGQSFSGFHLPEEWLFWNYSSLSLQTFTNRQKPSWLAEVQRHIIQSETINNNQKDWKDVTQFEQTYCQNIFFVSFHTFLTLNGQFHFSDIVYIWITENIIGTKDNTVQTQKLFFLYLATYSLSEKCFKTICRSIFRIT